MDGAGMAGYAARRKCVLMRRSRSGPVVMLSQAEENHVEKLSPGRAFPLLYSQITVNKWNMEGSYPYNGSD